VRIVNTRSANSDELSDAIWLSYDEAVSVDVIMTYADDFNQDALWTERVCESSLHSQCVRHAIMPQLMFAD